MNEKDDITQAFEDDGMDVIKVGENETFEDVLERVENTKETDGDGKPTDTGSGGADGGDEGEPKPEDKSDSGGADDFDFAKNFEGYGDDVDSVKQLADRGKLFTTEVESELTTLRQGKQQMEALQKEVTDLKGRNPFNDSKFYQLDKLSSESPEKAKIFQRYMFGENSPEDVVRLKMMLDHPDIYEENPGYLQRQLREKFSALYDDEVEKGDVEYLDAQTALKLEAAKAKEFFEGEIGKVEIPQIKTKEDNDKDAEAFFKSWQEPFAEVKKGITKLQIPVLDDKDDTKTIGFVDYDIPEADVKAITNFAANHIFQSRLKPGKEGMQEAIKVALGIYLVNNQAKINTFFANSVTKEMNGDWRKRVNNPKKSGSDVNVQTGKGSVSEDDAETTIVDEISRV